MSFARHSLRLLLSRSGDARHLPRAFRRRRFRRYDEIVPAITVSVVVHPLLGFMRSITVTNLIVCVLHVLHEIRCMKGPQLVRHVARVAVAVVTVVLATASADAAAGGDQSSSSAGQAQEPSRSADFLFGRPDGSVAFRGNWVLASTGSDLYDFVTRQLTIDKSDFDGPGFSAELALAITRRVDAQFDFEWAKTSMASEYRDFVDNQLLPIEQSTSLKTIHLGGSVRYAVTPRGHEVSRFAWVPRRVVPFVGAGAGVIYYEFLQSGDFVDFQDLSVFADAFRSKGWTPSAHAFGGVDIQIYRVLYGSIVGRYTKAAGELSADFIGFDPIDLSGFRLSAGINVLF